MKNKYKPLETGQCHVLELEKKLGVEHLDQNINKLSENPQVLLRGHIVANVWQLHHQKSKSRFHLVKH